MITISAKDILGAELFADVLVNPVNCLGVPGAGLARQFSEAWPIDTAAYTRHAKHGNMSAGDVYLTREQDQWIAHLATKEHYLNRSQIEWVELGLRNLVAEVRALKLPAELAIVALPMLGCGHGKLDPEPVIEAMFRILGPATDVNWRVHVRDRTGLHARLLRQRLDSAPTSTLDELKLDPEPQKSLSMD